MNDKLNLSNLTNLTKVGSLKTTVDAPVLATILRPETLARAFDQFAQTHPGAGPAVGGIVDLPDGGARQDYQNVSAYVRPNASHAYEVHGAIRDKFRALGAERFGYPVTDETTTPDGIGRYNHFSPPDQPKATASIYWTPVHGANEVYGAIRQTWSAQGWELGPLGYPRSGEFADGDGRVSLFERGRIRWTAAGGPIVTTMPTRLQFRLRYMHEHQSNDSGLQGASDELSIAAVGLDSSAVVVGPDGKPAPSTLTGPRMDDFMAHREQALANPFVLLDFDLTGPAAWPRTFTATLLLVEVDNEDIAKVFNELESKVGSTVKNAAIQAASTAAGALAGAAIGSIVPGVGTAIGAAVGALAGAAYDTIIAAVRSGLANDVFTPIPLTVTVNSPDDLITPNGFTNQRELPVEQLGARYVIFYDWWLA
ncbi:LGFP repeat-containing protein [Leifsonia poae]|uniref:LGFP repeat-containing protein n=1 Tax=Leifsonia poae TaxID=110933 RepID=UPI001CBF215A|nr:glycine zipper domain-containing protein [Leifsonia poae]